MNTSVSRATNTAHRRGLTIACLLAAGMCACSPSAPSPAPAPAPAPQSAPKVRVGLDAEPLELVELPGLRAHLPGWKHTVDQVQPGAGIVLVDRYEPQREAVFINWSITPLVTDVETIRATMETLLEEMMPGARFVEARPSPAHEFSTSDVLLWRGEEEPTSFAVSAFQCPDDVRTFLIYSLVHAELEHAHRFHERLLAELECGEAPPLETASFPTFVPSRPHTREIEDGTLSYSLEGQGQLLIFPAQNGPDIERNFNRDPLLRLTILEALSCVPKDDAFAQEARTVGDPPRPLWRGMVETESEPEPFELLLSGIACDAGLYIMVYTPEGTALPDDAEETMSALACP